MTIKCIIVDDEPLARQVLRDYIKNLPSLEIVSECRNAIEAASFLHQNKIDLMFLDIKMPGLSGLDFLKTLSNAPKVIITTAYSEYALQGYEYSVLDYLLKPFSFARFLKAVNNLQVNPIEETKNPLPQKIDFIFLKADKQEHKVKFSEIRYLEASGNYIKVHTDKSSILVSDKMKYMEEKLPTDKFIRVHRSFIVLISKIEKIDGNMLKIGKDYIPIGKLYKMEVEKIINKYRLG